MRADRVVVEAVPGLWSIPVEIPIPGLEVVYAYAIECAGGLVLVDSGWSSARSLTSLEAGLAQLGASLADVRVAVFTHAHGDHYGLASVVKERSGAPVGLHADDVPLLRERSGDEGLRRADRADWLAASGVVDPEDQRLVGVEGARLAWDFPPVLPDFLLVDGAPIDAPGWDFVVAHTPGHSPGHVCLVDEGAGVVLTGDHVLARTTPNISVDPRSGDDPLRAYLRSLDLIVSLGDRVGLPGHEERLGSVAARARELIDHHGVMLEAVEAIVRAGATTVIEVARKMPWTRPWARLSGVDRRLALGEAAAHLVALERRGRLAVTEGHPLTWRLAA